jgi:hypothetical protein
MPDLNPRLRTKLRNAAQELALLGYTADFLAGLAQVPATEPFLYLGSLWGLLLRKDGGQMPDQLARFFFAGQPVSWAQLAKLLSRETLDALLETEIIAREGKQVRAVIALVPYPGLYFLSDFPLRFGEPDFVFLPDSSAGAILQLAPPAASSGEGTALDLGTGSGVIALTLARRHGFREVRAVDINPRALALTRLGAALSGVTLELARQDAVKALRESKGLECVTFALPHLYTVPKAPQVVAHSAREGDALLWNVIAALGTALGQRGKALLYHQAEAPVRKQFGEHVAPLLKEASLSAIHLSLDAFDAGVVFGLTELARGEGKQGRLRVVRQLGSFQRPELQRRLVSTGLLEGPREELLRSRPLVATGAALTARLQPGQPRPRLYTGPLPVPDPLLPFLFGCDGTRPLTELLTGSLTPEIIDVLSWLVERGLLHLVPAEAEPAKSSQTA